MPTLNWIQIQENVSRAGFLLVSFNGCKHPAHVSDCNSTSAVFAKVQWSEHFGTTW